MRKMILGAVVGAVVYFAWGMVSWMALPWHDATMRSLPEEQLLTDTMRVVVKEPGVYYFPSGRTPEGRMDPAQYAEKYKRGPAGFMAFSPGGTEPMSGGTLVVSFLSGLFIAAVLIAVFGVSRDRVIGRLSRIALAGAVGLAAAVASHVAYWNWFGFGGDFTLVQVADVVFCFALVGAVVSFFVPRSESR